MSTEPKGGKAYIVVGARGMGKSTWVKHAVSLVHPDNLLVYDVNREYTQYYNAPFIKFPAFCQKAAETKDKLIVFEEATIFLSNRGSNVQLIEILVESRHTRNIVLLVFHSFRSIPKYLLDLCNFVVIYKTNDPLSIIENFENPDLTKGFADIRDAQMLQGSTKMYSPHKIVQLIA